MHKVEGNALIYSLFIVLVISSIITLLLMISQYSAKNVVGFQQSIQSNKNIESGLSLLLSKGEFQELNSTKNTMLFSSNKNEIVTKRIQWGLYEIVGTKNRTTAQTKYGILGYKNNDKTTLYLTNTNQALKLAGNTQLKGNCYLPEKGIERATITGHPYKGNKLIYGSKLESKKSLPKIKESYLKLFEEKESMLDSIVLWDVYKDSVQQSFTEKTLHFISSSPIVLNQQKISGNVIIESSKAIKVTSQTNLSNIVLKAPYILVEENYKGILQLQARDSIVVGEGVSLDYPSSLLLYDNKPVKDTSSYIKVGEGSRIVGELLAYQKMYNYRDKISVQLAPKTTIIGNVYVNGAFSLKKTIIDGSVYCQQFILKTGGSSHANTLLDVSLSFKNRAEEYLGSNYLEGQKNENKAIINWLE